MNCSSSNSVSEIDVFSSRQHLWSDYCLYSYQVRLHSSTSPADQKMEWTLQHRLLSTVFHSSFMAVVFPCSQCFPLFEFTSCLDGLSSIGSVCFARLGSGQEEKLYRCQKHSWGEQTFFVLYSSEWCLWSVVVWPYASYWHRLEYASQQLHKQTSFGNVDTVWGSCHLWSNLITMRFAFTAHLMKYSCWFQPSLSSLKFA